MPRDPRAWGGPYATRSNAHRAARARCRALLGSAYDAREGPDYAIHPESEFTPEGALYVDRNGFALLDRASFELRSCALLAALGMPWETEADHEAARAAGIRV